MFAAKTDESKWENRRATFFSKEHDLRALSSSPLDLKPLSGRWAIKHSF